MANREAGAGQAETEPRSAAVTFVTTEHFTLQGARSSTIAEATGRATMFLTVSAMVGLVTAVLAGSAAGLLAAVVSDHVLIAALIAGVLVAIAVFAALIHFQ